MNMLKYRNTTIAKLIGTAAFAAHLLAGAPAHAGLDEVSEVKASRSKRWRARRAARRSPSVWGSRLGAPTSELEASIALDGATRDRAGYVCADFVLRPALEIRGRAEPVDVWSLPVRTS